MNLVNEMAEAYAQKFSSPLSEPLAEIYNHTLHTHAHANMLSSAVQGKFLEMISYLLKPCNVLEIGTFSGFSALCLAAGMPENGQLHTIEIREEDAKIAQQNFDKNDAGKKIILHTGNALQIIPTLNMEWDLVFIDADKVNYINYYELTLPVLKKGGFILADNVLFHGMVLQEEIKGKNPIAIQAFNEHVANDNRVAQVLLTVRDGLTLVRKK